MNTNLVDLDFRTVSMDVTYHMSAVFEAPLVKSVVAVFIWVSSFLGVAPIVLGVMLGFFFLDFCLGVAVACRNGRFRCRNFARGLAKFPVYCCYVLLVFGLDVVVDYSIGFDIPFTTMFVAYLAANDAVSILAKCKSMRWKMPKILEDIATSVTKGTEERIHKATSVVKGDSKNVGQHRPLSPDSPASERGGRGNNKPNDDIE